MCWVQEAMRESPETTMAAMEGDSPSATVQDARRELELAQVRGGHLRRSHVYAGTNPSQAPITRFGRSSLYPNVCV